MRSSQLRKHPIPARRHAWAGVAAMLLITAVLFCCVSLMLAFSAGSWQQPEAVWGRRGVSNGRFQRPRAIAIDRHDEIYIVDKTARIQVFDVRGRFLRGWRTPAHEGGKPTGLGIGIHGNLLVADTHYYRLLVYSPEGKLRRIIGGTRGCGPGQFCLVTDVVQDSQGNLYVAEKGACDRVQKLSSSGEFLLQWGGHGRQPGQFVLPQSLALDAKDRIWVVDACNHRIQVFDDQGKLLFLWGREGDQPGELYYPYDLVLGDDGSVYVCEYGNHRIQQFTQYGRWLACWGTHGRQPGQLDSPWGLVRDSRGTIHVLDTNNHRVQSVAME